MSEEEQTTLHLIRSAAMQEFLKKKDSKSASLRNIVKNSRCDNRCILWLL